jgi:hypothetical protein
MYHSNAQGHHSGRQGATGAKAESRRGGFPPGCPEWLGFYGDTKLWEKLDHYNSEHFAEPLFTADDFKGLDEAPYIAEIYKVDIRLTTKTNYARIEDFKRMQAVKAEHPSSVATVAVEPMYGTGALCRRQECQPARHGFLPGARNETKNG